MIGQPTGVASATVTARVFLAFGKRGGALQIFGEQEPLLWKNRRRAGEGGDGAGCVDCRWGIRQMGFFNLDHGVGKLDVTKWIPVWNWRG